MSKYLLIYKADEAAGAAMAEATPEQQQASMQAWMDWFGRAGSALVDGGAQVAAVGAADPSVGGYSIVEADGTDGLQGLLDGHPHVAAGGTIEAHELLPMPGM